MDKKVGVVIFSVFVLIGLFLVAGYYTGLGFYGGSWLDINQPYSPQTQPYAGEGFGGDLLSFYYGYSSYIDFALFLALFLFLTKSVFGRHFDSGTAKGVAVVLSIILALSLTVWEARTGIYLIDLLGQYAFLFIIVGGVLLLLFTLRRLPRAGLFVISLIYLLFYYLVLKDATGFFFGEVFYQLIYYNYFLARLFDFLLVLAWVGVLAGGFMALKGLRQGGGN